MLHLRRVVMSGVLLSVLVLSGCAPVGAPRNTQGTELHERLSQSIHSYGFSHGVRSVREDDRKIDTVFVTIPLDSLKRQFINLHHMLFNAARLCARPEYASMTILIELNAGDESDREYMRKIVEPLVAEAKNVKVVSQRESANDFVVTISYDPARPAGAVRQP